MDLLGWHLDDTWMILWWYSDNTWMVFGWYLDDTWLVLKTCVLPRQVLANEFTASLHSLSAWKWLAAKKYWLWLKGRLNTAPSFMSFFLLFIDVNFVLYWHLTSKLRLFMAGYLLGQAYCTANPSNYPHKYGPR